MKKCDTCIYRNNVEQLKPCIIYRDDCEHYEKERGDMTREEAIELLKEELQTSIDNKEDFADIDGIEKYNESLAMAIKTLEQEPCEDAISRKRVMAEYCMREGVSKKSFVDIINELPSVNPQEPKTGHWKRISIDKYSEHAKYWYRCDRCGKDNLGNTDWCPNCGCRMFEPQESEG